MSFVSLRPAALVLVPLAALVAGCGSDGPSAAPSTTGPAAAEAPPGSGPPGSGATDPTDAGDDEPRGGLVDQYGQRYCEVLTITVAETTVAEVWGTQGLGDCPRDGFDAIDPAAVAAEMGVTLALPNGPRYWVLDEVVANDLAGSGEIRTFGGLEMRSIAQVDLGPGLPDRQPYRGVPVERDTEFVFAPGREVHELTAPDGSVYVMQSFSVEVDPTLTLDTLAGLADRLALPEGWTFRSRVLDDTLVVEDVDGVATVVQDELRNSYQLRPDA